MSICCWKPVLARTAGSINCHPLHVAIRKYTVCTSPWLSGREWCIVVPVGVLARDPYVLHQVAKVLLQQPELEWGRPLEVLIADDCFGLSTISSVRTADILSRAVTDSLGLRLIITVHCLLYYMHSFDHLIIHGMNLYDSW